MQNPLYLEYPIAPGSGLQIFLTVLTIAVSAFFGILFGKNGSDKRKILFVSGIILAASEVFKAIYLTVLNGVYPWSDFPFQLCSIPMYLCFLYCLTGKLYYEQFIMVYSLIGSVASFCVPSAVFSPYIVLTAHSLLWHGYLFFLAVFLIIRTRKEEMRIRNFIPVGILYLVLSVIAVAMNAAFADISKGRMNMFFLGPNFPDMLILNDIYNNSGWIPATLGMIGTTLGAGLAVYLLIMLIKAFGRPDVILSGAEGEVEESHAD